MARPPTRETASRHTELPLCGGSSPASRTLRATKRSASSASSGDVLSARPPFTRGRPGPLGPRAPTDAPSSPEAQALCEGQCHSRGQPCAGVAVGCVTHTLLRPPRARCPSLPHSPGRCVTPRGGGAADIPVHLPARPPPPGAAPHARPGSEPLLACPAAAEPERTGPGAADVSPRLPGAEGAGTSL